MYFSGTTAPGEVSYHDLASDTWAPVRGLPEGSGGIAYVTGDVIALFESAQQGPTDAAARSIEGRVSPEGIFSDPRTVERGRTVWSSDGTELVQQRPGGLVLQDAVGLRRAVPLAVPESLLTGPAMWDVQWEGSGSLLLSLFTETEPHAHVFRCSPASGHCVAAPELGSVAASNNTSPGG